MPKRGRTTAILLATGAVVVGVLAVVSFKGDLLRGWFHRQSDSERIQGKWKIVSIVESGQALPESKLGYCIFEGEMMLILDPNGKATVGSLPVAYRLDEDHKPGWFDTDRGLGEWNLGIYELNGDTLRICSSWERPTGFETEANSGNLLIVLQRE